MGKKINRDDPIRKVSVHKVAAEFAIELMFDLAKHFNTNIDVVMQVFDITGYWKVINDDELCCVQAHSGSEEVIEMLADTFNKVLSSKDGE